MNGNKQDTEAAALFGLRARKGVGERCCQRRSRTETSGGASASDYAGMSNDKTGENPVRRKPKVSWGR
jgi:hypothetical protein